MAAQQLFLPKSAVQVLWAESQEYFPAEVERVEQQPDGTVLYDVCYAQRVDNKDVVEKGVEAWRVIPPPQQAVAQSTGGAEQTARSECERERESVPVPMSTETQQHMQHIQQPASAEQEMDINEAADEDEESRAELEELLSAFTPDSTLEERAVAASAIQADLCPRVLGAFKNAQSHDPLRMKTMLFANALIHMQTQQDLGWAAVITHDKPVVRALSFAASILEHIVTSSSTTGSEFSILPSESLLAPLQLASRLLSITFGATHRTSSVLEEEEAKHVPARGRTNGGAATRKRTENSVARVFTHISALLEVVSELHRVRWLEDSTIIASYEAALEALSLDSSTVTSSKVAAVLAEAEQSSQLRRLHESAASLLQLLFQRYDSFRRTLMLELLSTMSVTCGSKKIVRSYSLHFGEGQDGSGRQFIHRTTATLLHFLQSATHSSSIVSDSQQEAESSFESMLDHCRKASKFFLGSLFQRAQVKDSGAAYKQALEHLVTDVLVCLPYPEWPAVEIVLGNLASILTSSVQVLDPRTAGDLDKKDTTWHNFMLDLLASVTASLWKRISNSAVSNAPILSAGLAADIQRRCEETMAKLDAAADAAEQTTASSTDLRRIDRVLHFKAAIVGQVMEFQFMGMDEQGASLLQQPLTTPDIDQVLEAVSPQLRSRWRECAGASDVISNLDTKYQILLEVLSARCRDQQHDQLRDAISLHALLWREHTKQRGNHRLLQLLAGEMHMDHVRTNCSDLSWHSRAQSELVQTVMRELLLQKTIHPLADRLLSSLLLLVAQESPTIRAKIVKGLSSILAVAPDLMAKDDVRACVVERFNDVAISVRQAAVDLVGGFVTSSGHAMVVAHYLDALLDRLRDVGVSVRKSVVKICRDILLHFPDHPRALDVCRQLVERSAVVKEEDTIRDTIRDTFYRIWLAPSPTEALTESYASFTAAFPHSPGAPYPATAPSPMKTPSSGARTISTYTTPSSADRTDDSHSASDDLEARSIVVAKQLVDVVQSVASSQWMVGLFRDLLCSRADGSDSKKSDELKRAESIAQCQRIVDVLIHAFLLLERTGTDVVGGWRLGRTWEQDVLGIMSTLAVFSEVQPTLLVSYVHIFLPLLKADNGLAKEGPFCLLVANIVARTVSLCTTLHHVAMDDALADLSKLCTKYEPAVVNGAMACMAHIIRSVTHDATRYLSLAQLCYSRVLALLQHLQTGKRPEASQVVAFLPRCLLVLGAACRYLPLIDNVVDARHSDLGDAREDTTLMPVDELPQTLQAASFYQQSYSVFVHLLHALDDVRFQARAATALCGAFAACPQLMYHADTSGLLSKLLRGGFGEVVRLHVLQSLQEVLRAGEELIDLDREMERDVSDQVRGGRCDDASIAGAVLQEHVPLFLQLLVDRPVDVKKESLGLLGLLLQQGMVCPHDVLPSLFALQGAEDELLRAESLRLIQLEDERRPGHLSTHCASGVFLAAQQLVAAPHQAATALRRVAKYIKRTPTSEPELVHQIQSIFAPAYMSCLQGSRQTRNAFLNTALKKCKDMLQSVSEQSQQKNPRRLLRRVNSTDGWLSPASRVAWVSFVTQTVAHLPYATEDEVLTVIWWINRHTMLEASHVCAALAAELQHRGVDLSMEEGFEAAFTGDNSTQQLNTDLATLVADALCLACLHGLKQFLKTSFKLSTDKCVAFNPYAKCNDKLVVPSDMVFEPVPIDVPLAELEKLEEDPQAGAKLEEIFRHLVAVALETADDLGVLGAKRKARRGAAEAVPPVPPVPAAPAKSAPRRVKPKKRRRVQKTSAFDSEDESYDDDEDESDYEP